MSLTALDIAELILLVVVFAIGVGSFIYAALKDGK